MPLQKKGTTRTGSITQTPLNQQTNKPYLRLGKTDNSTQQTF